MVPYAAGDHVADDGRFRPEPLLLTVVEAAAALRLSRSRIFELLADGHIESVKIGSSRRIPARALVRFVDSLRAGATSPPLTHTDSQPDVVPEPLTGVNGESRV